MKLTRNNQGVVVGLVIMICTVILTAIMFAVSMPAAGIIWESILQYDLPPQAMVTMNLLNTVSGITLIILVIGTIAYGVALAMRRDPYDIAG